MPLARRRISLCAAAVVVLSSCSEEEIRTYRVAAEEQQVDIRETRQAGIGDSLPTLRYVVPDTWTPGEPGQFQTALYELGPDTQFAVSRLPGEAGGRISNVNRWQRQLGLEPTPSIDGETIEIDEGTARAEWFNLLGKEDGMLAAMLPAGGDTWFFKLTAPAAEIEARRPEFVALLESIRFGTGEAQSEPAVPPTREKPAILLDVPDGWKKSEGSAMRVASFSIPGNDGIDADVSVIPLFGDSGSALENVNRWRNQLRLPPLESDDDPAIGTVQDTPSGPVLFTHMVSEKALFTNERHGAISTGILKVGDTTWFFKLSGEEKLVSEHRESFEAFVRSAVLPQ